MAEPLAVGPAQAAQALRRRTRFIGLAAGLIAGVLNAGVARVLMRIIALIQFGHGSFSVAGTAVIFMFGMLVGPLFGLLYRGTLYRLRAPWPLKGLLFGLILVVTLQVPGLYLAPEFMRELMAVGPLGFAVFGVMNFAFVLTLAALTPWLEWTWPRDDSRAGAESGLTAVFGFLALCGLALLIYEIGGRLLGIVK
jgi:hypothetical protein